MPKSKEMKKLKDDIAEAEFARELFFLKTKNDDENERSLTDAVVYALCRYLKYLYDKKEAMLEIEIRSQKREAALQRQKRRAVIFAHGVRKRET